MAQVLHAESCRYCGSTTHEVDDCKHLQVAWEAKQRREKGLMQFSEYRNSLDIVNRFCAELDTQGKPLSWVMHSQVVLALQREWHLTDFVIKPQCIGQMSYTVFLGLPVQWDDNEPRDPTIAEIVQRSLAACAEETKRHAEIMLYADYV